MAAGTENVELKPGYITLTDSHGRKTDYPIASVLRAADIPSGLTYSQVGAITTLANLVVILIRTLIDRDVLDEKFLESGDFDLESITEAIALMGGDYQKPDISVS